MSHCQAMVIAAEALCPDVAACAGMLPEPTYSAGPSALATDGLALFHSWWLPIKVGWNFCCAWAVHWYAT